MNGNKEELTKKKSHKHIKSQQMHKKKKSHKSRNEMKIDIQKDDRFEDFNKPQKTPPVDMYGRPITPNALENYVSSSDDEIEMTIPEDALPSKEEKIVYDDKIFPRIAVLNQKWKQITAQDLFQYFYINMDDHGDDLLSVKVVLSRYGQENPETEAPPPSEIEEIETALWRTREENESKRYFAICEFKDAYSANLLYEKLGNVEISEDKGGFFDLRFIDDEQFDAIASFPVRDEAHEYISDWNPPDVDCKSQTSTKNNDTWDSAPPDRVEAINKIWQTQDDDFDDEDEALSTMIASGSENEERPTRAQMKGTLDAAFNEEEDEMNDLDSDEQNDIQVDFVEGKEENDQLPEKIDENKEKNKKHKKKSIESINDNFTQKEKDEEIVKDAMEDDRFQEYFAKPGYSIDTSESNFKRTGLMEKYMNEISKKHMEASKLSEKGTKQEEPKLDLLESSIERLKRKSAMRVNSNKK